MAQIILAVLALLAGLYFLAIYLVDLYNARRGATAAQPAAWQLLSALGLFAISGLWVVAFFAH